MIYNIGRFSTFMLVYMRATSMFLASYGPDELAGAVESKEVLKT